MTSYPLLSTKLFLPAVRAGQVARPRLLRRLDQVLHPGMRLALISAPAGFGKTSLLAEWAAASSASAATGGAIRPAWLALDSGDNEVGVFLAYLMAAIERARPGLVPASSATLRGALAGAEPLHAPAVLADLVNELAALPDERPLIIALDDFQFISAPAVREALAFLLEHLPPGTRLAIATRADPALPLARMRARGQMVELRAADLRFTESEASDFLADGMGLKLSVENRQSLVTALTERTEGWAAGLQMAGLALQTAERPPEELVRTFSGSHRFVIDYLAEEVLAHLPAGLVNFLLQTAVLDRFCAPLCQAVMHEDDPQVIQSLLHQLEHGNLFLVPMDEERHWFRYHHLFADLLRARLKQADPGRIPAIHQAAAAWFEANQLPGEAIQHALAGADYERAARLVENHTLTLFRAGQLHGLQQWIAMLPAALSEQRPLLCVFRAWVQVFSGQIEPLEALLVQAESHLDRLDAMQRALIEGHCAAIRCHRAVLTGQMAECEALAQIAVSKLSDPDAWVHGFIDWNLGYAARLRGELERAAELFTRRFHQGVAEEDPWGTAMNAIDLGAVRRLQGRLRESIEIYQSALAMVEVRGARRLGYTGRLLTALASGLYERNELQAARRCLEEALDLNQRWKNPNHLVFSFVHLGRVLAAEGDYVQAEARIHQAGQVLRDFPVLAILQRLVEAARLGLALAQGQAPSGPALDGLLQAALQSGLEPAAYSETGEIQQLLAVRLLLAQTRGAHERGQQGLLDRLEAAVRAGGRGGPLIEILVLQALSHAHPEPLAEALALAEPQGYRRVFLDAAPLIPSRLAALLSAILRRPPAPGAALAASLLADLAVPAAPAPTARSAPSTGTAPALVEQITEREMEVLRLLAEGLTNPQIGERLVISPGTVKAHTAAIFRKLDASTRTQAVTVARQLGLLR